MLIVIRENEGSYRYKVAIGKDMSEIEEMFRHEESVYDWDQIVRMTYWEHSDFKWVAKLKGKRRVRRYEKANRPKKIKEPKPAYEAIIEYGKDVVKVQN